jgi:hypothetical protein
VFSHQDNTGHGVRKYVCHLEGVSLFSCSVVYITAICHVIDRTIMNDKLDCT